MNYNSENKPSNNTSRLHEDKNLIKLTEQKLDITIDIVPVEPSHVTIKDKVILALFYQKSYPLSRGGNALDDPENSKIFCT